MEKRTGKRLLIIFVYLSIFLFIAWFVYSLIAPEETCMDGIKNQNEEEIDCGGGCSPCIKIFAEPLSIGEKGIVPSGIAGEYDFYVQVKNPNSVFGSQEFSYEVVFHDPSGSIMASRRNSNYILPGDNKYIVETNVKLDAMPASIDFQIHEPKWTQFQDYYSKPELKIVNKSYNEVTGGVGFSEAKGLLKNESPFDFDLIKIRIFLKDAQGQMVAINSTEMRTVKSEEERDYRAFWPSRFPGEVRNMETQVEVNVFDSDTFLKRYFKPQGF